MCTLCLACLPCFGSPKMLVCYTNVARFPDLLGEHTQTLVHFGVLDCSFVQAFSVLLDEGISVQMMSQGASKVNISLIVDGDEGQRAVKALHAEFFEKGSGHSNGTSKRGNGKTALAA